MPHPRKILLVDDSPVFVELEKSFFQDLPYEILTAGGGEEGIEKALAEHPDLVLLDEEMPDLSGHEVLERLRRPGAAPGMQVILVTGTQDERRLEQCMSLGISDYLRKPFDADALLRKVGKAMGLAERKAVSFLVRVRRSEDASFARAVDISVTGMRVSSGKSFAVGEPVELEFFVPGNRTQVRLAARVVRRLPLGDGGDTAYGLRFEHVPPDVRTIITAALKGRS